MADAGLNVAARRFQNRHDVGPSSLKIGEMFGGLDRQSI
jgi:hypothetical protein